VHFVGAVETAPLKGAPGTTHAHISPERLCREAALACYVYPSVSTLLYTLRLDLLPFLVLFAHTLPPVHSPHPAQQHPHILARFGRRSPLHQEASSSKAASPHLPPMGTWMSALKSPLRSCRAQHRSYYCLYAGGWRTSTWNLGPDFDKPIYGTAIDLRKGFGPAANHFTCT